MTAAAAQSRAPLYVIACADLPVACWLILGAKPSQVFLLACCCVVWLALRTLSFSFASFLLCVHRVFSFAWFLVGEDRIEI